MKEINEWLNTNKMKIKAAGFFFENDKPWGFGQQIYTEDHEAAKDYVEEVIKGGNKIASGQFHPNKTKEELRDILFEDTRKLCRKRVLAEKGILPAFTVEEDTLCEFCIITQIQALTILEHPMTKTEFTGTQFMYGN